MNNKTISKYNKDRRNERGNAALVAMIFLAFASLTVLTIMASSSLRESRNLEKSRSKLHEKWQARSGVNILAQIVAKDAPRQMESDVRWARENCGVSPSLPIFDGEDMGGESSPAVVFDGTDLKCASGNQLQMSSAGSETTSSIFGTFTRWRDGRVSLFETTGRERFALEAEKVKIIQLDEIYRRTLIDSDVAYAVRYIVESKYGNYRTRTNGEMILGASLPTCGTSAELHVNPSTVERGNPVEMQITYAYANHLQIFNSAGALLHEESVTEQSASQIFTYRFTPAMTDTYRVTASGSGGCQARSTNIVITVTEPPAVCPLVVDFSASSTEINEGETVMISWNVQDAGAVVFEGSNVAASGSQSFTLNATRTFTLTARDTSNNCPITRQITVTVRPRPPACGFATPQINFSANPNSIAVGGNSTLTWNITGLEAGGTAVINGAGGFNQTIGASGSQIITPPASPGDYTYTLTAVNVCPDGTRLTATATVVISVRVCPPPSITTFTVNPSTVIAGENQMITFAWNVDGTADAVSISNGVGGGLPSSGTVDIPQPQTTTIYTITAVGCGQTRQYQITVVVEPPPTQPCSAPRIGDDFQVAIGAKNPALAVYTFKYPYPKQIPILRWVAINALADSVRINGQPVPPKGERLLDSLPPGDHTFTITATSLDGATTKTDNVTISIYAQSGAGTLTLSPNPLRNGMPLNIFDSATGSQVINPNDSGYPMNPLNPIFRRFYGTAEKFGYWEFASSQEPYFGTYSYLQTIPADDSCPVIKMFSASPFVVNEPGQTVRLNWTVENGSSIFIEGIGDVTGLRFIDISAPASDTNYKMIVTSPTGCTDDRTALLVVRQKGLYLYGEGSVAGGLANAHFSAALNTPPAGNAHLRIEGYGLLVNGPPANGGVSNVQVFNGTELIYNGIPPYTVGPSDQLIYDLDIPSVVCPSIINVRISYNVTFCSMFGCESVFGIMDSRFPNNYGPSSNGFGVRSQTSQFSTLITDLYPTPTIFNFPVTGFYY